MRNVFCYKSSDNDWTIIDKANGKVFETINDVLLFNGIYKKYKNIRGWHGILSEEFNNNVKSIISAKFLPVLFKKGFYYPRIKNSKLINAKFIRLRNETISVLNPGVSLYDYELSDYTREYDPYDDEDMFDDEDDYEDDEDNY